MIKIVDTKYLYDIRIILGIPMYQGPSYIKMYFQDCNSTCQFNYHYISKLLFRGNFS